MPSLRRFSLAALLIIVVFVPGGIVGLISRADRRIRAWVAEEAEPA